MKDKCNVKIISTKADIDVDIDVFLWKVDLVHDLHKIRMEIMENEVFSPDLIVLCNPGGQLTSDITCQEKSYLVKGGVSEAEIVYHSSHRNVALLHKWAIIYPKNTNRNLSRLNGNGLGKMNI